MEFRIPYMYPDRLISEHFVRYSDEVLSSQHDPMYTTATGFQDVQGGRSSDIRTRALELYDLGLLRGRLVNPQSAGGGDIPHGWSLVQSDEHVHTCLGYMAYAIGKAMKSGDTRPVITHAFEALCTLFVIQLGVKHNGKLFLLSSLFLHVLESFSKPRDVQHRKWLRYVAAAFFCTLHSASHQDDLIEDFTSGSIIQSLMIIKGNTETIVTPRSLADLARNDYSLTDITPPKPSLFWIGDYSKRNPRGLFLVGARQGQALLEIAKEYDMHSLSSDQPSPFQGIADKPEEGDAGCILDELRSIVNGNPAAEREVNHLMQTLYEGVINGLRYLHNQSIRQSRRILYAHGVHQNVGAVTLNLEVPRGDCAAKPETGDAIIVNSVAYAVETVDESDAEKYRLMLRRIG